MSSPSHPFPSLPLEPPLKILLSSAVLARTLLREGTGVGSCSRKPMLGQSSLKPRAVTSCCPGSSEEGSPQKTQAVSENPSSNVWDGDSDRLIWLLKADHGILQKLGMSRMCAHNTKQLTKKADTSLWILAGSKRHHAGTEAERSKTKSKGHSWWRG